MLAPQFPRHPDSLVFERIMTNHDASTICVAYRARNGFGGMNRETVVFVKGEVSQSPDVWNKRCGYEASVKAIAEAYEDMTYVGELATKASR